MEEIFIDENTQIRETSAIRKIFFNLLGFITGYLIGYFALKLSTYIFIDLLGEVKFITSILSYPAGYDTYALTAVILSDAFCSLYACAFISKFGKAKYNYSCFVLGTLKIILYVTHSIQSICQFGFNFSFVWTIIICLIGFIALTLGAGKNEEL